MRQVLTVDGMHCKSCKMLVEEELSSIAGIRGVEADFDSGRVDIIYDGSRSALEKAKSAIKGLGYVVR